MKRTCCVVTLVTLFFVFDSRIAAAADLENVERKLTAEPSYLSDSPKYCLLVFGSELKTHGSGRQKTANFGHLVTAVLWWSWSVGIARSRSARKCFFAETVSFEFLSGVGSRFV
jgi:hypothetical protein